MSRRSTGLCALFLLLACFRASAGVTPSMPDSLGLSASRFGLSAGMGVNYMTAPDIVDLVNMTSGATARMPEFKSAVEFFGAGIVPLTDDWDLKLEYAYLLASYNSYSAYGPAEFTVKANMPSVIAQYILVNEGVYNVKIGAGGGYHFGSLSEKLLSEEDRFTASGPGFVLDLEANTAFGEHLFAYLGANARWEMIGTLSNSIGRSPGDRKFTDPPTLQIFGVGARLGATYYF